MTEMILHLLDSINPIPLLFEGISFGLLALLTFIAFVVGAAQCSETTTFELESDDFKISVCRDSGNAKASLAFAFFLWVELAISAGYAFVAWNKQRANPNSGAPAGGYFVESGNDQDAPVFE